MRSRKRRKIAKKKRDVNGIGRKKRIWKKVKKRERNEKQEKK